MNTTPDTAVRELVRRIHATPHRACIVVTGAGTQAVAWLFAEPGTSRTVLDAQVPYSRAALDEYVGGQADQHVSAGEALKMAHAALKRAQKLAAATGLDPGVPLAGIGCTAAIATDRVRRGDNRVHVGWAGGGRQKAYSLVFIKGARERKGEEAVGSMLVLNALAEACGISDRLRVDLRPGEAVVES
jgi:hypothetical protein